MKKQLQVLPSLLLGRYRKEFVVSHYDPVAGKYQKPIFLGTKSEPISSNLLLDEKTNTSFELAPLEEEIFLFIPPEGTHIWSCSTKTGKKKKVFDLGSEKEAKITTTWPGRYLLTLGGTVQRLEVLRGKMRSTSLRFFDSEGDEDKYVDRVYEISKHLACDAGENGFRFYSLTGPNKYREHKFRPTKDLWNFSESPESSSKKKGFLVWSVSQDPFLLNATWDKKHPWSATEVLKVPQLDDRTTQSLRGHYVNEEVLVESSEEVEYKRPGTTTGRNVLRVFQGEGMRFDLIQNVRPFPSDVIVLSTTCILAHTYGERPEVWKLKKTRGKVEFFLNDSLPWASNTVQVIPSPLKVREEVVKLLPLPLPSALITLVTHFL